MAKHKTTTRIDTAVKAYIEAEAARLCVSESQVIGQILDAHMRSAPIVERSIEQAASDLHQHITDTTRANHTEVVGLLSTVLEALLKLIETSASSRQSATPAQRAALFQPNNN